MKLKLKNIISYLVLFCILASNFSLFIQPITAYSESEVLTNVESSEVKEITEQTNFNKPIASPIEDSSEVNAESSFETDSSNSTDEKKREALEEPNLKKCLGEELAARKDPYDVKGLTNDEIISLANYLYGDYAKFNSSFELKVRNEIGELIDIPFIRAYATGTENDNSYFSYKVYRGSTWLFTGSYMSRFRIDGQLAYCVQPGVLFKPGEGFNPQINVPSPEIPKDIINKVINFGAKSEDSKEDYCATQLYIWELMGYTVDVSLPNYDDYKNQINERMNNFYNVKPSFNGGEFTVKVGETLTLTDSNDTFVHYDFAGDYNYQGITRLGNNMMITPSIDSNDEDIIFHRKSFYSGEQYFWVKSDSQSVATGGALESVEASLRLKIVKTGSAAAQKLDEQGNPLAGAIFKFEHSGIVEERTTGSDGIARIDDILMGTEVIITEIKAPDGRVIENSPQKVTIEVGELITRQFTNRWARQPIKLIKREKDANRPLEGVPFALYKITGVTKTLVDKYKTDTNGEINIDELIYNEDGYIFKELEPLHGFLPNENEYNFKVTPEKDGQLLIIDVDNEPMPPLINTTATGKNGEKFIDPTKEIELEDTIQYKWLFTGRNYLYATKIVDKETAEVLETFTGTFTPLAFEGAHVVKVKVDGHKYRGKNLVFYEYIYDTVSKKEVAKHENINDSGQTIKVNDPNIKTKAQGEDGRQVFNPLKKVKVKETVTFTDLVAGHKYTTTVQGYKLRDETPYEKASLTKTFVATKPTMEMDFEFELNGKELQGNGIVFTEKLFFESEEIATHEDLKNEDQTTKFTDPKITTKARGEDELQLFDPHEKVPVKETAVLTDLIIGDEYKVTVQGYRLSTGKIYEKVKEELVFTATETEMELAFDFVLDGKELAGDSLVFTETLTYDDEIIAEHKDLSNAEQTITFTDPKIKTKAFGDEQKQTLDPLQKVIVKETAEITDLIIGNEYTVDVQGYRLSTGKAYEKVHKEVTFIADKKEKKIEFDFSLEGKELRGDGIVFTETLSHDGEIISIHNNLNNKDQTVCFSDPNISTIAQGKNGEKVLEATEGRIIKESAKITGLVIGNQYKVKVKAHRLSDGSVINGISDQKTFIADKTEMTIDFEFKVDGQQFTNDGIVFTEILETKHEVIAKHIDLTNEQQTVRFNPITTSITPLSGPKSTLPSTGEKTLQIISWLGLFMIVFSVVVWLNRKKNIVK